MLPDFKADKFFTALNLRHVHLVALEVSIGSSGAPTLVTVNNVTASGEISFTSPGLPNVSGQTSPIVRTGTGAYTVQLMPGKAAALLGAEICNNGVAFAASDAHAVKVLNKTEVTNTFSLLTLRSDTGVAADPVNGSTMTLFFLLAKI